MSGVIGHGCLVVKEPAPSEENKCFSFQLSQSQIQFYSASDNAQFTALEWWNAVRNSVAPGEVVNVSVSLPGHIVLSTLPATPYAAFSDISVGLLSTGIEPNFTLTVRQEGYFAANASEHVIFRDLDILFTQTAMGVQVSGSVKIVLFNQLDKPISLEPAWRDGHLIFRAIGSTIPVGQIGALENIQFTVQSIDHPWNSLQVLYSFDAAAGTLVQDVSGKAPINLTVFTPNQVAWKKGTLITQRDAKIASAPHDAQQPLPPPRPVQRLIDGCKGTQEISFVLWIKPKSDRANGPARLITQSKGANDRNFLIGQDLDRYVVRLRTTSTTNNGQKNGNNILQSQKDSVQQKPTCLVFTRSVPNSQSPNTHNAYFYVDGEQVDSTRLEGDFSNWENYELSLANEFKEGSRFWEGEFYRVAIYNQALTPEQVRQLYYPRVLTTGDLNLTNMPAPLNQALSATIDYEKDYSLIRANATTPRLATPQFQFDRITLSWRKIGTNPWALETSSAIQATLWGQNSFVLKAKPSADRVDHFLPLVAQPNQPLKLVLEGLGTVTVVDFELQPRVLNDRPQWQLTAKVQENQINLPNIDRPFDFKTDFQLTTLGLAVEFIEDALRAVSGDRVVLKGQWLGQSLSFYGVRIADQFLLRSAALFKLPFNLTLGPIHEPGTTVRVADEIKVCPTPGCRQVMNLNTLIELSRAGFVAVVNGTFLWEDGFGRQQTLAVPEFTTFNLPTTPNALLAEATANLRRYADRIFAPAVQSKQDFYAVNVANDLTLVYGSAAQAPTLQETILPAVLTQNGVLTVGLIQLVQAEATAKLNLSLREKSASQIKTDYAQFLQQFSSQAKDTASFLLVKQRLAERLPLPMHQGLQFRYGYTGGQTVDLVDGMRLRVEYQNYQFVHPVEKNAETGFISSGTAYYSLHFEAEGGYLGFDPFLSTVPIALEGPNQGIGGLVDLLRPGYRKPFYRLLFPDEFAAIGRIGAERVALLVGADTFNALEQATNYYQQPNSTSVPLPASVAMAYFRGRATVVPEIAIFVQEQPEYVPVGTTLRQVLARYGQVALRGRLQRVIHEGVNNTPDYRFVNLGDPPALDLPLVQGDRVYV